MTLYDERLMTLCGKCHHMVPASRPYIPLGHRCPHGHVCVSMSNGRGLHRQCQHCLRDWQVRELARLKMNMGAK